MNERASASLARLSAFSFPGITLWLGIHSMLTFLLGRSVIRVATLCIKLWFDLWGFWRASMAERESERIDPSIL